MDSKTGEEVQLPPPPPLCEGDHPSKIPKHHELAIPPPRVSTRQGFGKAGSQVDLVVNHFKAQLVDTSSVYHYDVSIKPPLKNKKITRDVMTKLWKIYEVQEFHNKQFVFDGDKMLLTHGSLSFKKKEFIVYLDKNNIHSSSMEISLNDANKSGGRNKKRKSSSRTGEYIIEITFVSKIRMQVIYEMMKDRNATQRALRVLNTMLHESVAQRNFLVVNNNFFHPSLAPIVHLGEGVVGWRGYHSSIVPTSSGLSLNFDIAMTCVLDATSVEEFLREKFHLQSISDMQWRDWAKASHILKNIKVQSNHTTSARVNKIIGFSEKPIQELMFKKKFYDEQNNKQEEEISVLKYLSDAYHYKTKYPYLPALNVGNKKQPVYLPLETCTIVEGQRYNGSLTNKMRQLEIAACKQGPQERQRICENAIKVNDYGSDKLFREFGVQFDTKLSHIEGRILTPPQLEFGEGKIEQPREGRWNFTNKTLAQGVDVGHWAVLVFDPRCNDGDYMADQLRFSCCKRGMRMGKPMQVVKEPHNSSRYSHEERVLMMFGELKRLCSEHKPTFILAILPQKDSPIYGPLKKLCEVQVGVISQCMVRPQQRQMNDHYFGNLALKINLKFGGYNSVLRLGTLKCLDVPTIIFGMDVSHGSPGDANSIAAVVATKNWPNMFHYSTQVRVQPKRVEMIQDLQCMVRQCLLEFYKSFPAHYTKDMGKPRQIVVYRDGLSDDELSKCLEVEFMAFKRACRELGEDYNPGITFIVAQKRHSTRFFPQGQECLKNGNVLPGTVVDKVVCHPLNYDFFLVSHAGLIGTSRPTHYHVLADENNFGPDNIQALTYDLCHTFGVCTTSTSMAAPAAYAHVLAARYMIFAKSEDKRSDTASLRSSRNGSTAAPTQAMTLPIVNLSSKQSMFFV